MYKLKIKITKDILKRSMCCTRSTASSNCAVAIAVRDIFPDAIIGSCALWLYYSAFGPSGTHVVLPDIAKNFISEFDGLYKTPEKRLALPEFEFEVDIPDLIIQKINIGVLNNILENHPHLNLITE